MCSLQVVTSIYTCCWMCYIRNNVPPDDPCTKLMAVTRFLLICTCSPHVVHAPRQAWREDNGSMSFTLSTINWFPLADFYGGELLFRAFLQNQRELSNVCNWLSFAKANAGKLSNAFSLLFFFPLKSIFGNTACLFLCISTEWDVKCYVRKIMFIKCILVFFTITTYPLFIFKNVNCSFI